MLPLRNRDFENNRRPPIIPGKSARYIKGTGSALKAFDIDFRNQAIFPAFNQFRIVYHPTP